MPRPFHILIGAVSAAPVGGLLFALVFLVPLRALDLFGVVFLFATLFVLATLLLLFVPGWFAAHALGVHTWIVAPIWGALSMLLAPVLVQIAIDGELRSYTPISPELEVLAPAVVGAMVGSIVWWIAHRQLANSGQTPWGTR